MDVNRLEQQMRFLVEVDAAGGICGPGKGRLRARHPHGVGARFD